MTALPSTGMDDDVVRYEVEHGVTLLTLNRPDRMNAWTLAMEDRYFDLLLEADTDPTVRAVVVTGTGAAFASDDFKEEVRSFLDGRPPAFAALPIDGRQR